MNKAERNAFAKLIPAKWIAAVIAEYVDRSKRKTRVIPATRKEEQVPEGTTATPEVPQSKPASPDNQATTIPTETNTLLTKDQATPEMVKQGFKQRFLAKGLKVHGVLNILNDEMAAVPQTPMEDSALLSWLNSNVLQPLSIKHKLTYELKKDSKGCLTAILIHGHLEDKQLGELANGCRWAFEKATENR